MFSVSVCQTLYQSEKYEQQCSIASALKGYAVLLRKYKGEELKNKIREE